MDQGQGHLRVMGDRLGASAQEQDFWLSCWEESCSRAPAGERGRGLFPGCERTWEPARTTAPSPQNRSERLTCIPDFPESKCKGLDSSQW